VLKKGKMYVLKNEKLRVEIIQIYWLQNIEEDGRQ